MVQHLAAALEPHDVVITYPSFLRMPVRYYLDKLDPAHTLPRPTEYASGYYRQGSGVEPEPDWQRLHQISAGTTGRVWLIADEKSMASWTRLNRVHVSAIRAQLLQNREIGFTARHMTMSVQRFDKVAAEN